MRVNDYIKFCAGKTDENRDASVISGMQESQMSVLQTFQGKYSNLVTQLQKLAEVEEKYRKANSARMNAFHDQKSDAYFSNYIPSQAQFEDLGELSNQVEEIKKAVKDMTIEVEEYIEEFKAEKGMEYAQKAKSENQAHAQELLEEYSPMEGRISYSPALAEVMGYFADKKMDLDIESFSACEQLVTDIRENKVNLNEHVQQAKAMEEKECLIDHCTGWYEDAWVGVNIEESEESIIKQDGEHLKQTYEKFSNVLDGKANDEEKKSLLDAKSTVELIGEPPQPKLGIRIQNAFRKLFRRPQLLMSQEKATYVSRSSAIMGIYDHTRKYMEENNLIPKATKEKTEFDKSVEVTQEEMVNETKENTSSEKQKSGLTLRQEPDDLDK